MTPSQSRLIYGWLGILTALFVGQWVAPLVKWDGKITIPIPGVTPSASVKAFVLVHESGDDGADFASLKVATRKDEFAKQLAAKGITLEILDKDQAAKYMPKDGWPKLPAMVAVKGDKTLAVESLPAVSLAEVTKLVEKHGGALK